MYSVSGNYNNAIYPAPGKAREVKGRVTFDISDVTAVGDINSITPTAESQLSNVQQTVDKVRSQTYKFATCEKDRFKLDGSFCFADDIPLNNGKLGFCSNNLSNEDGSFTIYPQLTYIFNGTHSSIGLTITFDVPNGEYATDFNMSAYDINGNLITSVDVTGNTSVMASPIGLLYNYAKVVVTIKKWCKPYRRARVCEIDFGIVEIYDDNNLISMDHAENMDLTESPMTSPEFTFVVDNSNKLFNILNPQGFYKYLQQRQQVIAELGVNEGTTYEYIPLDTLYLNTWDTDDATMTATLKAVTLLELMTSYNYECLTAKSNYNLYQLAVDIFAICGITDYEIDDNLKNIATLGLSKSITCKTALQYVATAGCANIYVTRAGKIIIKVSYSALNNPVDTISMNDMYQEPKVTLDSIVMGASADYYTDLNTNTTVTVSNSGVTTGDTYSVSGNTFINTSDRATAVANWVLQEKNYRAIYSVDWRGNPAYEMNDIVDIENSFGDNKNAIITGINLHYEGYLSGTLEARGLSNGLA